MKIFIACVAFLMVHGITTAQDTIYTKQGTNIEAKVLEITSLDVKYKRFDNQSGPTYSIHKVDITKIRYENGIEDQFEVVDTETDYYNPEVKTETGPIVIAETPKIDYFWQGQQDAQKYYRGYRAAGTVTLITTFLFIPAGLIPAIGTSATTPKDINLNFPSSELMKNPDYRYAYTAKSKRMKQGKVWTNFGIGAGAAIILGLILGSAE